MSLDAEFADDVSEFVSLLFAESAVGLLQFFGADFADVAERVGGQLAVEVKALRRLFGADHRILVLMRLDPGEVTFGEANSLTTMDSYCASNLASSKRLASHWRSIPKCSGQQIGHLREFRVFDVLAA